MLRHVEQAIEILEQGLEENTVPAAKWTTEPKAENSSWFWMYSPAVEGKVATIKAVFVYHPTDTSGGIGRCFAGTNYPEGSLWYEIPVPALPEEGGSE